jgi:hypothetical protein
MLDAVPGIGDSNLLRFAAIAGRPVVSRQRHRDERLRRDPHPLMDAQVAGRPALRGGRGARAYAPNPAGMTAIGDGIELGKAKLVPLASDAKAMIVLTDGIETASKRVRKSRRASSASAFGLGSAPPMAFSRRGSTRQQHRRLSADDRAGQRGTAPSSRILSADPRRGD